MAKQTINTGATANDGTGDTERAAWIKTNANFTELYDGMAPKATSGTSDPTVNDDSSAGYSVGSRITNTDKAAFYTARSVSVGAAEWIRMDLADHPGYVSGRWYQPIIGGQVAAGSALGANRINLLPFPIKERVTLQALGVRVTTAAAGGNVQVAIYAMDPTTKAPTGNALASTGNISTASTGAVSAAITGGNVTLNPGLYWMAVNSDNTTNVLQTLAAASSWVANVIGSATLNDIASAATVAGFDYRVTGQTFGTWPSLTSASFAQGTNTAQGMVYFQVA